MSNLDITYKGLYTNPQNNDYVRVKQYMYARDEKGQYILLRFFNASKSVVRGLKISVAQYDAAGNLLSVERYFCDGYKVPYKGKFAFKEKIELNENCADFKVNVLSVDFGKYRYNAEGTEKGLCYVGGEKISRGMGEVYGKKERKLRVSPVLCTVVCLILALVAAITAISVIKFKDEHSDFILKNVYYAFENGDESETSNVYVTGYRGKASQLVIPDYVEKHKVVTIKKGAFKNTDTLNTIIFEGSPSIEESAFENCERLEKVEMGGVTQIAEKAFYKCKSLKSVQSDCLTTIGERAFENCVKLNEVKISSENDVNIGVYAFRGCSSLSNVDLDCYVSFGGSNHPKYFDECGVIENFHIRNFNYAQRGYLSASFKTLFSDKSKDEKCGAANVVIDYIDGVSKEMFIGMPIKSLTIKNDTSTVIEESAFEGCASFSSISLPVSPTEIKSGAFKGTALTFIDADKLQTIGDSAFEGCANLNITFQNNAELGEIGDSAFKGCSGLTKIYVPAVLKKIGANAFEECANLATLENFEKSFVSEIGAFAFNGCSSLTAANLPSAITVIKESTFADCKKLSTFTCPAEVEKIEKNAFSGCEGLAFFALNNKVTSIGVLALAGCTSLKEIDLAEPSVKSIGIGALKGDTSLESIKIPFIGETANAEDNEQLLYLFCSEEGTNGKFPETLNKVEITDENRTSYYHAFSACTSLKTLIIPYVSANMFAGDEIPLESVTITKATNIPSDSFYQAKNLKEITYPDNLVSIGERAFYGCAKLEKIVLTETLTSIGDNAFMCCYKLNDVLNKSTALSSVTRGNESNGAVALYAVKVYNNENDAPKTIISGDYKLMLDEDYSRWLYVNYYGTETQMTFPTDLSYEGGVIETYGINDYLLIGEQEKTSVTFGKVNYIGKYAFSGCSALENFSASTDSTATAVGENAFYECGKLKSFSVPSVETVKSNAFSGCSTLKTVSLPNANIIETNAFSGCERLESVTVNVNSGSNIGSYAFSGCVRLHEVKNLGSLSLTCGYPDYGGIAQYAIGVYNDINEGLNIKTEKDVVYKNNGKNNVWYATDYTGESTAEVGAFGSVKTIYVKSYAFNGNTKIKGLVCGSAVKGTLEATAFSGSSIATLDLTNSSVTTISNGAFSGCSTLKTVSLPNGLNSLGSSVLPSSVENLSTPLFKDKLSGFFGSSVPSSLKEVTLTTGTYIEESYFSGCSYIEKVTLPSGITSIGNYAFSNCYKLSSVNIPNAVTNIGESAFSSCSSLKTVNLPSNLKTIGSYAFSDSGLTEITVPGLVNSFGASAFSGCSSLTTATVNTTTALPNNAFSSCTSLETVSLPSNLRTIGNHAFSNCYKLSSINIPSTVTNIGEGAFSSCSSLKTVNLPSNLKTIGSYAFSGSGLTEITVPNSVISFGASAFSGCSSLTKATVNTTTALPNNVFSSCTSLETVSLPSGMTTINGYAFYYCSSLKTVSLPSSLKTIGENAFYNCSSLKTVSFPNSLNGIGSSAFNNCSSLTEINLKNTAISSIGSYAFYDCTGLTKASFPTSLSSFGTSAFYDCKNLREVHGSSYLSKGSQYYGYVAYYAIAVNNTLNYTTSGDFAFAGYGTNWFLYRYNGNNTSLVKLPDSFSYNGTTYQYTIHRYAFENSISQLVVPTNVKSIDKNAFYDVDKVYFKGTTQSAWQSISGYNYLTYSPYYYNSCAHESNQWKYDDGAIVTEVEITGDVISDTATCTQNGYKTIKCSKCGKTRTEYSPINSANHNLKHVARVEATTEKAGNIEYWYCSRCGKYFSDKNGNNQILQKDTIIAQLPKQETENE